MMNRALRILALPVLLCLGTASAQTTATDFTLYDCAGEYHHLFGELDGGKIIVVSFVMPCMGCISPSNDVQNVVESYNTTYPGRVNMYLADDDGLTGCATLGTWRNANGLHLMPTFSDTAFVQSQYGVPGMPKIVVLGGTDHHVWDIENDVVSVATLGNAIDAALGITTGIKNTTSNKAINIYPNPASGQVTVSYTATTAGTVTLKLIDIKGAVVKNNTAKTAIGNNTIPVNLSGIPQGTYIVRLSDEKGTSEQHLIIK